MIAHLRGLSEEEFRYLQLLLLENPKTGSIIQGTGGLRKARFGAKGKGKKGGVRVIYYFFGSDSKSMLT